MFDLLQALKKIIERKIVNIQPLRENISAGATTIPVKSVKRFDEGADVVIYREGEDEGEIHQIYEFTDYRTMVLTTPVSEDFSTSNTRVQNIPPGGQWIKAIYIGDPPVIPRFPAITIHGDSRSSDWLTLDSTSDRYEVSISVYIDASTYDKGYEYVLKLTRSIERTLFHNFYPLVVPYCTTTLTDDVTETDTVIRVENDDLNRQFLWFFVENDRYTRPAHPAQYLDNGVIELRMPIGVPFSAGDDVIFPWRHFYDTRAESTTYGSIVKNSLLWGSRISYFAVEETLRVNPYADPLNRD